jgi:8-oxo-dGTP pyrophosphatase MutT (NUDIX family)
MDLALFKQKDDFLSFVTEKLNFLAIDYKEKNMQIEQAGQSGSPVLKAGVVLLLHYKETNGKSEYVFQLIKRSEKVSQGGDISCPGGMLQPKLDNILGRFIRAGIIPGIRKRIAGYSRIRDKESISLVSLFLSTALREAWEEIGLNPLNTKFLGALPSYSLTLLARTIFPVVCATPEPFAYRLSSEVEKILEIPVSFFFNSDNYAILNIKASYGKDDEALQYQMPCLVIPDGPDNNDILWGATFNIITNFLRIISDNNLPSPSSSRILDKVLTVNYISGKS